jgi:hypothetical protein
MVFITKLGPQVSLSPVPYFGVNKHVAYSARGNNITCKAVWWVAKVQVF